MALFEIESGPFLLEPTICDFSCKGTRLRATPLCAMEVPMTIHHDRITDSEDATFDATMKIMGVVLGLVVIAGAAFWYIYS